jgi:hypothetical protein
MKTILHRNGFSDVDIDTYQGGNVLPTPTSLVAHIERYALNMTIMAAKLFHLGDGMTVVARKRDDGP